MFDVNRQFILITNVQQKSVFERSSGLDKALYKKTYLFIPFMNLNNKRYRLVKAFSEDVEFNNVGQYLSFHCINHY